VTARNNGLLFQLRSVLTAQLPRKLIAIAGRRTARGTQTVAEISSPGPLKGDPGRRILPKERGLAASLASLGTLRSSLRS
jgi:hypothetical protein